MIKQDKLKADCSLVIEDLWKERTIATDYFESKPCDIRNAQRLLLVVDIADMLEGAIELYYEDAYYQVGLDDSDTFDIAAYYFDALANEFGVDDMAYQAIDYLEDEWGDLDQRGIDEVWDEMRSELIDWISGKARNFYVENHKEEVAE